MGKTAGAVLAGATVWAVLWIGGNTVLAASFPDVIAPGEPVSDVPVLLVLIGYSVVLSLLAGFTAAAVEKNDAMTAVKILAGLQLAIGILFEATSWSLLPAWYHIVFLLLIVPATLAGGRLKGAPAGA